jgi:DNA (cytosine-5)-methyltransferase 1
MYVPMNYLSVCSGIEAATVAWQHLDWNPLGFSEIEKFPAQVLATHYPLTPNMGDMTNYKQWRFDEPVNLIVGGTPCQSFSVAGLRKGLEDPRGNLALTYVGLLDHFKPEWFIWENVPGVLSSNQGQDFSAFLSSLAIIGYGFAYRVLDAQYFGVPQRRRRVFVVGCSRGWQYPAKVLFEPGCLSGDLTKGRKKREETPANVGKGFAYGGSNPNISDTVTNKWHKGSGGPSGNECGLFVAQVYENHPSDSRVKEMGEVCTTVTSKWGTGGGNVPFVQQAVAIQDTSGRDKAQNGKGWNEEVSYTLDATGLQGVAVDTYNFSIQGNVASTMTADMGGPTHSGPKVMHNMAVRRLTPTECERLQGFPDGYTDIKPNGKQTPDGPRYKALGNSMAVPVMRWIGERINKLVALNNLM